MCSSFWAVTEACRGTLYTLTLFLWRSLHTFFWWAERGGHRVPSPPILHFSWLWALVHDTSAQRPVPAHQGKGTSSGQLACSEQRGIFFSWNFFRGRRVQTWWYRNISVFTGVGFACVLHDASESSLPLPQMRCFVARVSKQQGSLLKFEISHGFEIPFQHVKPYQSCVWVRRTYLFIYCYTSVKDFIKLKAEAFWFFYLQKSSKPPFLV